MSIVDGKCDDGGGTCTLRAAIQEANVDGNDTIEFGITGCPGGVCTIAVGYALPTIIQANVTIDGYTQSGASANTNSFPGALNGSLKVVIDGVSVAADGTSDGLSATANGVVIKGLVIHRFPDDGISITGGGTAKVQGCYVGTDVTG